jgi:methionyl-tRNA synthetase
MLKSAGFEIPKEILVHGFITSGGQKMSKSLGNVVLPEHIFEKYSFGENTSVLAAEFPKEIFRYYFLKNINPHNDGDFTWERLKELYNADLANGLGNLVSRVMKLSEKYLTPTPNPSPEGGASFDQINLDVEHAEFADAMKEYDVMNAMNYIWKQIGEADNYMQTEQPFKVVKVDVEKGKQQLQFLREKVYTIARLLNPFMPTTSDKIKEIVKANKMPEMSLFPRYE